MFSSLLPSIFHLRLEIGWAQTFRTIYSFVPHPLRGSFDSAVSTFCMYYQYHNGCSFLVDFLESMSLKMISEIKKPFSAITGVPCRPSAPNIPSPPLSLADVHLYLLLHQIFTENNVADPSPPRSFIADISLLLKPKCNEEVYTRCGRGLVLLILALCLSYFSGQDIIDASFNNIPENEEPQRKALSGDWVIR